MFHKALGKSGNIAICIGVFTSLHSAGYGQATLDKYTNPAYFPGPARSICNTSPLVSLADPLDFALILGPCDLDCIACKEGKCSITQERRCKAIAAQKTISEAREQMVQDFVEGRGLFVFKETPTEPVGARVELDPEMDVLVIEVPKGYELDFDKDKGKLVLRITDDDQLEAPSGISDQKIPPRVKTP